MAGACGRSPSDSSGSARTSVVALVSTLSHIRALCPVLPVSITPRSVTIASTPLGVLDLRCSYTHKAISVERHVTESHSRLQSSAAEPPLRHTPRVPSIGIRTAKRFPGTFAVCCLDLKASSGALCYEGSPVTAVSRRSPRFPLTLKICLALPAPLTPASVSWYLSIEHSAVLPETNGRMRGRGAELAHYVLSFRSQVCFACAI